MIQLGGDTDFAEKPRWAYGRSEVWFQHFDRNTPIVSEIVCQVDGRHPTTTEFPLNRVAVSQRRPETIDGICQNRCLRRPLCI